MWGIKAGGSTFETHNFAIIIDARGEVVGCIVGNEAAHGRVNLIMTGAWIVFYVNNLAAAIHVPKRVPYASTKSKPSTSRANEIIIRS